MVSPDHFLRKLREIIDWKRFTRKLIRLYKGEGVIGRPPFDPTLVLKVELIAYLYNLTERQVEVYINENLPAKFFVGLPAALSVCLKLPLSPLSRFGRSAIHQNWPGRSMILDPAWTTPGIPV